MLGSWITHCHRDMCKKCKGIAVKAKAEEDGGLGGLYQECLTCGSKDIMAAWLPKGVVYVWREKLEASNV